MIRTKILFVTFADGNLDYLKAGKRLEKQARSFGLFSEVISLDDKNFRSFDSDWKSTAESLDDLNLLPYYYLGTKAWLVRSALNGSFGEFDVIFYADAGCEMLKNFWTKREVKLLLRLANRYGGVAEQLAYPEKLYSKKNIIDYFQLSPQELEFGQIQATWSIWKNSKQSRDLANEWVNLSNPYFNYWHDPEGLEKSEQSTEFIDHRRDQSIFSILWKKNNYYIKPPYWEYGGKFGRIRGCSVPVHATRNRTGKSNIKPIQKTFIMGMAALLLNFVIKIIRGYRR